MVASEHRGNTRDHAARAVGVGLLETHALGGELVHCGRFIDFRSIGGWVAIDYDVFCSEVIDDEEQNVHRFAVWSTSACGEGRENACSRNEC